MLKILGSTLIILSGTCMGMKASEHLFLQNEGLKKLKKMIVLLRGEIKYNHTYLSQAFEHVSNKISDPFSGFLLFVSEKLNENSGKSFQEIWKESVREKLQIIDLTAIHLKKIEELGDTIGFLDTDMQIATFDLFIEQLDHDIEENNQKLKDNSKLYKCLGLMGGILVVLIIV
ncbi:MAG: stage III sporulation protein AB [Lachnospiraceae bacterium]|nr:stage III sporulation protein AB [Lachnospiraceae bacterium]